MNRHWFPANYELPDGYCLGRLLHGGMDWQIYQLDRDEWILIARHTLADQWVESKFLPDTTLARFRFGKDKYRTILSGPGQRLEPVTESEPPGSMVDGRSFASSLRETRKIDVDVSLRDAIYAEYYLRLLPTWTQTDGISDEEILGRWLTGGVLISAKSSRRLSTLLPWLNNRDVTELVKVAGFTASQNGGSTPMSEERQWPEPDAENVTATAQAFPVKEPVSGRQFRLPGRKDLEAFLKEYAIDIVEDPEKYKGFGIEFPTAIVLHGPPGCGKTFAVERLGEYLDWPIHPINSDSIGSPYVHGTAEKIGVAFDKARDDAPSMIVVDEMESYLSDRQIQSTDLHHIEEVGEFLQRIPKAHEHHVLVIGMTNRLDMIEPAILRRGRFDHVIEVGMLSAAEVSELLESLLEKFPVGDDVDKDVLIEKLTGRPLSDTEFVVREAARLTARVGKSTLYAESFREALAKSPPTEPDEKSIGFNIRHSGVDHGIRE